MSIKDALEYTQTLLAEGRVTTKEEFETVYEYWCILQALEIPCDLKWSEGEYVLKLT